MKLLAKRVASAHVETLVRKLDQEAAAEWLATVEAEMVRCYVSAILLARRYGLRESRVFSARERIARIEMLVGADRMRKLVEALPDPTDPAVDSNSRRHLPYVVGALGADR
jgi:hypothetical protein